MKMQLAGKQILLPRRPVSLPGGFFSCQQQAVLPFRSQLTCRESLTRQTTRPLSYVQIGQRHFSTTVRKYEQKNEERAVQHNSAQRKVNDRPWMRESGIESQPAAVSSDPSKGDRTKGRILTTPNRLLKLILPMPFHPDQEHINPDKEENKKLEKNSSNVEPLALLVHPQQPLSYLERLIQAEIPPMQVNGREKLPDVVFRAEAEEEKPKSRSKGSRSNISSYSGLGREGPDREEVNWMRWSSSTEVGDFIRDAARGKEFAIHIEGLPTEMRVAVPSFKDRTHYMRQKLRRMSREIEDVSKIKSECDHIAHRSAHRIAQGGFAALAGWWGVVYGITFHTGWGWDFVEPVTYLAGLATFMGGYLWFLYMSKDLSYKAAMNVTVSRRQNALYQERGVDLNKWEWLVQEANAVRRDIKLIASEYDVDWDETKDLGSEEVKEVLEKEKRKSSKNKGEEEEEEEVEERGEAEQKEKGESPRNKELSPSSEKSTKNRGKRK